VACSVEGRWAEIPDGDVTIELRLPPNKGRSPTIATSMPYATRWTRRPVGERSQVVPRRLATQDLRDSAAHYAAEGDAATTRRFIDTVEQAVGLLPRQPGIGSPRYAVELDWPGLRTHPVQRLPYLVFYLEQTDHLYVDVLRFVHAHRDIPASLQDAATDT
jgi:toxin ParE1/3/4